MAEALNLRVAVVGAGPSGFFAAAELLKVPQASVDLFDRLPAPFGLVRHGVAPDHPWTRSVTAQYDEAARAAGTRFRLLCNVGVGRDLDLDELLGHYHAVVLAIGASASRRLSIPGEGLPGVHSALSFVGWYNGHPDHAAARFDLKAERAVVVGVGNVALDVARILVKPYEALARTDMSDLALQALAGREVQEVMLLGRSGPAQAAFTAPELAEMAEIDGCDLVITEEDRALDTETEARRIRGALETQVERKLAAVSRAQLAPAPGRRRVRVRFWTSPLEILGGDRVEAVRLGFNRFAAGPDGVPRLEPTARTEVVPCSLVFLSIGYRVEPFTGVPCDARSGTVPNTRGQVLESGRVVPGLFVCGWAKRGPRGVIGSNKPDAQETARTLLEAFRAGALRAPPAPGDVVEALESRGVSVVSYPDWKLLDALEIEAGRSAGRPRRRFTDAPSMLRALAESQQGAHRGGNDG